MNANEAVDALRAAGRALAQVDPGEWDDSALARLAEAVSELDAGISRIVAEASARRTRSN